MARYAFVSTKAIHTVKVCENWALPKPRTRGDILKKSTDFHVRISNDELELIDEKAHRLRMTRSKYVIQAALHQKIIVLDSTSIKQLTSELRKIGININIIAPLYPFPKTMTIRKPKIKRTPVMAKTLIILFILDIRGSFRHF